MRKYQQLWEIIKARGHCRVASPSHMHARVKKAVTKEFNIDLEFKEAKACEGIRCWIRKISLGDTITFTLKSSNGFEDFGVGVADILSLELQFEVINLEDLLK